MSYNISDWRTKKIERLLIPVDAFFRSHRKDWHPEIRYTQLGDTIDVEISAGENEAGIIGKLQHVSRDGKKFKAIFVTHMDICGEESGTEVREILEPALKESTGYLEAVRIWEGGDSIDRLIVKDGKITVEEIDL